MPCVRDSFRYSNTSRTAFSCLRSFNGKWQTTRVRSSCRPIPLVLLVIFPHGNEGYVLVLLPAYPSHLGRGNLAGGDHVNHLEPQPGSLEIRNGLRGNDHRISC